MHRLNSLNRTPMRVGHAGVAANFGETKARVQGPPPAVGEHTREILREAGLSEAEIQSALDAGIVEERGADEPVKLPRPSL